MEFTTENNDSVIPSDPQVVPLKTAVDSKILVKFIVSFTLVQTVSWTELDLYPELDLHSRV